MKENIRKFKELLEQTEIPQDMSKDEFSALYRPLQELVTTIIPSKLYRYRECSEAQFDAFYRDTIYASTADKFNDPYDCLLRCDKQFILDSISYGASKEYITQLREHLRLGNPLPTAISDMYGDEGASILKDVLTNSTDEDIENFDQTFAPTKSELFSNVNSIIDNAITYMRQQTHVACFSETVKSVTMWSHYAKSHTGFALEYDMRLYQTKCDMCPRKDECDDRILTNLYPVIYSKKRYDATSFVDYYIGRSYGMSVKLQDVLFFNKAALYKSPQWSYEKEWRLFLGRKDAYNKPCLQVELKPVAIYYGNHISPINKKILSDIAKEKGIKEFQMYLDVESDVYSMKYKRC